MWVLHALQHLQLVIDHLLVSADISLQDNLDSNLALRTVSFSDNPIRASTQCFSEAISRPVGLLS